MVNLLKMTCAACLLTLGVACSDNTDNPVTPPTPGEDEMPALSEEFEEMVTWVTAAVKCCQAENKLWSP